MDDAGREMRDLSVAHGAREQVMSAIDDLVVRPFDAVAGSRMRRALDRVDSAPVREALGRLIDPPPSTSAPAVAAVGGSRRG